MKKIKYVVTTLALFLCFSSIVMAAPKEKEGNLEAIKAAQDYFQEIVVTSADGKSGTPLIDFEIVSVDASNPECVELLVETKFKDSEQLPAAPYKVVKVNGKYEVLNEPLVYNMISGSDEYGTVSIEKINEIEYSTTKNEPSIKAVIPNSYYYNSQIVGPGVYNYLIANTFSTTKSNVTINGWQELSPNSDDTSDIQLRYGIAEKLSTGSYKRLAESSLFKGDYPKNGNWLSAYLTDVPKGNNRVVYVFNEFFSTAVVSGNVYE